MKLEDIKIGETYKIVIPAKGFKEFQDRWPLTQYDIKLKKHFNNLLN